MDKPRKYPNKPQNNYGGNYDCNQYEINSSGKEWCHDEGYSGFDEYIDWQGTDSEGKLLCKGNRHNCYKQKLKKAASTK